MEKAINGIFKMGLLVALFGLIGVLNEYVKAIKDNGRFQTTSEVILLDTKTGAIYNPASTAEVDSKEMEIFTNPINK